MVIGILALQGDFAAHAACLRSAGVGTHLVRRPVDLEGLSAMVLPGGESSTMLRLLDIQGLRDPLQELLAAGLPVLATCAGLILLAEEVVQPRQASLGILPLTVARNGYGRQIHSGTFPLLGANLPADATGVFIRAPRILRVGEGLEVLARRGEDPVLVRQGRILAACFHPELDQDHFVIGLFLDLVAGSYGSQAQAQAHSHSHSHSP